MQEAQQITLLGLSFSLSSLPQPLLQIPVLRTPVPLRPLRQSGRRPLQSTAGAAPLCCTYPHLISFEASILLFYRCVPFLLGTIAFR